MAADDEIRNDENRRPATDRPEFHRRPLRLQIQNFGRAVAEFDWFGLFRKKRNPPMGSQSDRQEVVRESMSWPEAKELGVQKAFSEYSVQSVYPNEAKDWRFIDDDEKN